MLDGSLLFKFADKLSTLGASVNSGRSAIPSL